ncbi:hypothetical protein [Actinocrispum sp. NPDC049592]|uniref:hypothetical protein n=1 Tax=Actinocrispum sp. NPDC049592 TaxID=3154835 RepID=UPI00342D1219
MKIYTLTCDAPGLPLSAVGSLAATQWRGGEEHGMGRIRGGAIVAPKQMPIQGTSVRTGRPVNVDFPYISVRAGAQRDLT